MSITDDLRKFASHCAGGMGGDALTNIADRIDEVVASEYVRLPKDVDRVSIHPGDVIADDKNTYTVTSIITNSCGAVVYGRTETNRNEWPIDQTSKMHHVKHTTTEVEDMLEAYRIRYFDLMTDMENKRITNDEYARGIKSLNASYADRIREVVEHERD